MQATRPFFIYLALAAAVLCWGLSFVATKIALQSFSPIALIFMRFCTAALFFSWLLGKTGWPRLIKGQWQQVLLLAVMQPGLYFTFETIGLQYTTATKTSLLIATIPVVVLFLSALLLRERLSPLNTLGIGLSLAGVSLLVFGADRGEAGDSMLLGDLLISGAVLSAASYMVLARKLSSSLTPVQLTGLQIIIGAFLFLPPFLYQLPTFELLAASRQSLIAVAALTVFATIGAFLSYNYALARIPAARAAVFLNGIPLVTASSAWLLLDESLNSLQLLGGAVVLVAVCLANRS